MTCTQVADTCFTCTAASYELGPGEIKGNGRVVCNGRVASGNRSLVAELYFKNGTFLHARAFFGLVHNRLFVPGTSCLAACDM